ncbi:MAG: SH3 domain-containing protein [Clostridiales bacterium]|nr:SH3 domain-containing protein [Clostridiales bacterium]
MTKRKMEKSKTVQKRYTARITVWLCALCMLCSGFTVFAGEDSIKRIQGTAVIETDSLNVRSGPGKDYDVIGKAKAGEQFAVDGETSNGWYRIDYNGKEGYVSGEFAGFTDSAQADQEKDDVPDEELAPIPGVRGVWQKIKSAGAVAVIAVILIPVVLVGIGITARNMFQNRDEEDYDEEDYDEEYYEEYPEEEYEEVEDFDGEAYLSREVAPYIEEEEALQRRARELEERQKKKQDEETDAELTQAMEKLEELQKEIERIKQKKITE